MPCGDWTAVWTVCLKRTFKRTFEEASSGGSCGSTLTEQPQPKRRRRLDPSMIGLPTDFRHTAHIGSSDLTSTNNTNTNSSNLHSMQNQMSSKGDYDHHLSPGHLQIRVVDLPRKSPS